MTGENSSLSQAQFFNDVKSRYKKHFTEKKPKSARCFKEFAETLQPQQVKVIGESNKQLSHTVVKIITPQKMTLVLKYSKNAPTNVEMKILGWNEYERVYS